MIHICRTEGRMCALGRVMGGFGLNAHVDAGPHPGVLARYVNDVEGAYNVRFVKLGAAKTVERPPRALVVALRDVAAGEELYARYGSGYWAARNIDHA